MTPSGFAKTAGATWEQQELAMPNGDEVFTLNAIQTEFLVYLANYQLTSLADQSEDPDIPDSQLTFAEC